jgi:hypothetical protein
MSGLPPLDEDRIVRLVQEAIDRFRLDLSGTVVFTEAASGPYVVTPLLAARAGARRVMAVARTTAYGTIEAIAELTERLAGRLGVADRLQIVRQRRPDLVAHADVVTNSGHVRPLDARLVGAIRPGAVVPLMYESWALRPGDVDRPACLRRGIRVAGTNERHPLIDMYPCLGGMAVRLLSDAGVTLMGCRVLVVCDNGFARFLRDGLEESGARVEVVGSLDGLEAVAEADVVLIALRPAAAPAVDAAAARRIAARWPAVLVAQFWGDLDRQALAAAGVRYWPIAAPAPGHMGVLPLTLGPEPIVRLQAGGLKVAEVLLRLPPAGSSLWEFVDPADRPSPAARSA